MQPIGALGLALLGLVLAFAIVLTLRARDLPFWPWAWVAQLSAGVGFGAFADSQEALRAAHILATMFPALMLAGSFAFVHRAIPRWLLPVTATAAVFRASYRGGHLWIAPLEIAGYLVAAALLSRSHLVTTSRALPRLLSGGMVAIAAVEVWDLFAELDGGAAAVPWVAWISVGVPVAAIQYVSYLDVADRRARESREKRERAARELDRNIERFKRITENAYDVIIEADLAATILYASPSIERVLGYPPSEVLGHSMLEFVHPDEAEETKQRLGELAPGNPYVQRTGRVRHRDGFWVSLERTARAYQTEDGSNRLVLVARDVTERLEVEERLRNTQKLESLGVLAGGIAHDFSNLLTGIISNAELAAKQLQRGDVEKVHAKLEVLMDAGRRASELTSQLLAYAGKRPFTPRPLHLSDLTHESERLLRTALANQVDLRFDLANDLPAIDADPAQLRQILMNLVTNGVEACGTASGSVVVSTRRIEISEPTVGYLDDALPAGRYVALQVRDNGTGMDDETRGRIFDPFFTTKFAGRGLALAAVLGMVRAHRGNIRVESRQAVGITFTLLFPATDVEMESQPIPLPADEAGEGLILVVDDEDQVRDVAAEAQSEYGYDCLVADGGAEAVQLFEQRGRDVSLVLLDLAMPGMGGVETLQRLRALRPEVPFLIMSGFSEAQVGEQLAEARPEGFVQKPLIPAELAAAARRALGARTLESAP